MNRPTPPAAAPPATSATVVPTLPEMVIGFTLMTLQGFGGVLVFARRDIVERRRWMTAEEFNETFAICQLLPGANIVMLAVLFGQRHYGAIGAVLAFLAMLVPPVALVMVVAAVYSHYADIDAIRRILVGISVVASGLILSVMLKMAMPLVRQRSIRAGAVVVAVFVAAGILRLPLVLVLAVSLPVSMGFVWMRLRRGRTP